MDLAAVKAALVAEVQRQAPVVRRVAEELYRHPETGLQEERAAGLLTELLAEQGFLVRRGLAGMPTAFRASWGSGSPRVALLAEMDALPGLGHACGHNLIAAAALGAALALRQVVAGELLTLQILGTPAEELGVGKVELVKGGAFEEVDFALMVHPSSRRTVIKGYLGLAKVRFTFYGRAAHASAYPEEGVNALDGVIQTFNGINALRQHLRSDVRIHGIITDGGVVPNIIPERAACSFYVRAENLEELARVKERVLACASGAAAATGCRLEVEEDPRVLAPLRINRAFSALYSGQLAYLGLPESQSAPDRNRGSSDIGNVSQVVPTIHPHIPIGDGLHIHTEAFARATVSERGIAAALEGATALALTVAELALTADVQEQIRREFASDAG